ncbi:hypothetical protein K1T71_000592 [Dendrolimus kikuchii]|uniref:Uncharacterized protein n=1 Tax=Dendrolimus kikuchii TaxID=765133 RepID=A0ACC1DJL3_9NEOP|nr:hypothetical protein K1T71_000592 [Dendrolimus kikuchii]
MKSFILFVCLVLAVSYVQASLFANMETRTTDAMTSGIDNLREGIKAIANDTKNVIEENNEIAKELVKGTVEDLKNITAIMGSANAATNSTSGNSTST